MSVLYPFVPGETERNGTETERKRELFFDSYCIYRDNFSNRKETSAAQHRSRNKLGYKQKNLSDHI